MNEIELLPTPANIIGPTWQRTADGEFYLPELTLGWAVIYWMMTNLRQPGGPRAGEAFMPTDEQARFIVWWYAVDEYGKFVYRKGLLRRLKGWGKDPLAAALSLAELCGPVAFSHFDDSGKPIGKQKNSAWVQIVAVSQDQSRNTFALFPAMVSKQLKLDHGLDMHKTLIYSADGGIIEAVTSSPLSLEGKRPTFVVKNEIQWWLETNDGHRMDEVIAGNVDKASYGMCRELSIFNAHVPGQDSVAEREHDAYMDVLAGKAIDTRVMYDALEAPADTPLSEIPSPKDDPEGFEVGKKALLEGLRIAAGDAVWLPLETIVDSMLDTRRAVSESRRKFLNQVNAHEDSWIAPHEWDACDMKAEYHAARRDAELAVDDRMSSVEAEWQERNRKTKHLSPTERTKLQADRNELDKERELLLAEAMQGVLPPYLEPRDRITLGFDGSKSDDHSALVACRVEDGALFYIKSWDPTKFPNEEIPREDVDAVVRSCFDRYDVVAFRADVKEFEAYVDQWGRDFRKRIKVNATPGHPIAFDMRGQTKRFALDCERFCDAVVERELVHDGNPVMRQHVMNARRHPTNFDAISIRKASKDSSRKIDVAVCAVLAFGARQDFLMSKKNRGGKAVVFGG